MASSRTRSVGAIAAAGALAAGLLGASLPGKNSVTSNDIGKGEIGKSELRANSVGKSELRSNSVGKAELRRGSVKGAAVDEATLDQVPIAATVGGKSASQLDTRWALIGENGTIERQTGGFTIVNCFTANANCYIDAGEDVTNNGLHAQIAINNTDGSPVLSGETGVAPCGAAFVACAPPGTETANVIVVAPRASDGSPFGAGTGAPAAADAPRFYVFVTGSEG